ncbi:hypothetical protein AB0C96_27265 [Streptomyces sp. NPDC048506]|uniref:hypothetical protein n=1 Tax=Streptomyces sp. NPDC048506 TaxID=3155028 RepID=UPI00344441E1
MPEAERPWGLLGKRVASLKKRVRGRSSHWQAAAGVLIGLPLPVLILVMIAIEWPLGGMISTLLCGPTTVVAGWLLRPWFEELPRKKQRRIVAAPIVGYIGMVVLFAVCVMLISPQSRALAAMLLFSAWIFHSLTGTQLEPSRFPYEHLRWRLGRAAPMRVFTMWCALVGLFWLLPYARGQKEYKAALFGATITLGLAGVAASVRVLARARRLRTDLDRHAAELITALQELRELPDADRTKQQFVVQRAWKALHQTLKNRVDTGVSVSGVFVLPSATLLELERLVLAVQGSSGTDARAYRGVTARLRMICMACSGRTDTLT